MNQQEFNKALDNLRARQEALLSRKSEIDPEWYNGLYDRYKYPVLTRAHVPIEWRFDLNYKSNPHLMERLGINAVLNSGAIEYEGKIYLMTRTEGYDRKSFFALAASDNGIDNFRYVGKPIVMPETERRDTNVYDMRLVKHEDGWIYGIFCTERPDPKAEPGNTQAAEAQCGVARTKDLVNWERLKDIRTESPQQRNVVLHPEFVDGKYAFYTRPQDDFIKSGSGGGIGYGLSESIEDAYIPNEEIIDKKLYHTIKEVKNGGGAVPIKTPEGWLHIVHAVRECAAGMRYVLYAFMSELDQPNKVIYRPGGYLLAPLGWERVGDVSNVVFTNGAVARENGDIFIYYGASDTRMHVATTTIEKMVDYCKNTPPDPLFTADCVQQRLDLIAKNESAGK
ncbi:MAG: glycosidase [Candidatus Sumerlaeota bacterium]